MYVRALQVDALDGNLLGDAAGREDRNGAAMTKPAMQSKGAALIGRPNSRLL